MIAADRVRYDLVAITPDGIRHHLPLSRLSWGEAPNDLAQRLTLSAANVQTTSGLWLHQLLPLGVQLMLFADWGEGWQEVWRGSTYAAQHSSTSGQINRTAYDNLYPLAHSKDDRYYPTGTTGRTIITDLAGAWGLPLGQVDGPDVALSRQLLRSRSLSDIIQTVLDEAKKRGAGRWYLRSRQGLIDVVQAGANPVVYHFGADSNVGSFEEQASIENLVTRVKIMGAEDVDERRPVIATLDGRTEFGILQDIINADSYETEDAAREAASDILAERGKPEISRTVEAPDLPFLRRGDKVHITAGTLNGYYLVKGITHNADTATMQLEVEDLE